MFLRYKSNTTDLFQNTTQTEDYLSAPEDSTKAESLLRTEKSNPKHAMIHDS